MSANLLRRYDLAVVGAGAAGLAAALRGAMLGMSTLLVTRGDAGGGLNGAERIALVEGLPVGVSGAELGERTLRHARALGVHVIDDAAVASLERGASGQRLVLDDGRRADASAVVVATGVERALDGIDGAARFIGTGVHTGALSSTGASGSVYVAGELNAAAQAALELSERAEHVTVLTTEARASAQLPAELVRALRERGNVAALPCCELIGADGVDRLEVVLLRHTGSGRVRVRNASALWLVGAERARTSWLDAIVEMDAAGRLITGTRHRFELETSVRGLFAAGDARAGSRAGTGVRAALAEGMQAAEQARAWLEIRTMEMAS